MTIPLLSFDLTKGISSYINEGKDINAVENGVSFIEYALTENYDIKGFNELVHLLNSPELKTDHLHIQQFLFTKHSWLLRLPIQENAAIFIQRFNLLDTLKVHDVRGYFPPDNFIHSPKNWLNIFAKEFYPFFRLAQLYHPDFKKALNLQDERGNSILHFVVSVACQTITFSALPPLNAKIRATYHAQIDGHREAIKAILEHYPSMLYQKNQSQETPLELLEKSSQKHYGKNPYFEDLYKLIHSIVLKNNLDENLPTGNHSINRNKI